jgi:DnaJ-class molecular chaperone
MKLKPTVISAKCPACNGSGHINNNGSYFRCTHCDGRGVFNSVVLAPIGYDGVSEIEVEDKIVSSFLNRTILGM